VLLTLWMHTTDARPFRRYYSLSAALVTASYGAAPAWGSGALYATSIGLDRPLVNVLRDIQVALDPPNSTSLRTAWGTWHWQPCAPWAAGHSANPTQNASQLGFGRSWVPCVEWDGTRTASTNWNGVQTLSLNRMGLNGTMPDAPLCELNSTLDELDLSQNALTGTIATCLARTANAGGLFMSIFDNLLVGTVPAALTALQGVALAYNRACPRFAYRGLLAR
jgi:hypothetical protein